MVGHLSLIVGNSQSESKGIVGVLAPDEMGVVVAGESAPKKDILVFVCGGFMVERYDDGEEFVEVLLPVLRTRW